MFYYSAHMGSHIPSSEDLFVYLFGGWIPLCKELVTTEGIPYITMKHITTF